MNLADENGLQQDEWSLAALTFGENDQLTVIGWAGRSKGGRGNKLYVLKCSKCSQDIELFGKGLFKGMKGDLVNGQVPCGCSKSPKWSKGQFVTLCSRKAQELGYTFLGFIGKWNGQKTRIKLSCEKHGEWVGGTITNLINHRNGCPACARYDTGQAAAKANKKTDSAMIESFHKSGAFHPDAEFWRSVRKNSRGVKCYWHMSCPECGETGEAISSDLQRGKRPCACSPMRQQECYINWLIDEHNIVVAIKFGIARDSGLRLKQQDSKSVYMVKQHCVYQFPDVTSCKKAERECSELLECGVVLRRDMPDGYTETTYVYNLDKIIEIYERNGGTKNE